VIDREAAAYWIPEFAGMTADKAAHTLDDSMFKQPASHSVADATSSGSEHRFARLDVGTRCQKYDPPLGVARAEN